MTTPTQQQIINDALMAGAEHHRGQVLHYSNPSC